MVALATPASRYESAVGAGVDRCAFDARKLEETVAELTRLVELSNEDIACREEELLAWELSLQGIRRSSNNKVRLAKDKMRRSASKPYAAAGVCAKRSCDTIPERDEEDCGAEATKPSTKAAASIAATAVNALARATLAEASGLRNAWALVVAAKDAEPQEAEAEAGAGVAEVDVAAAGVLEHPADAVERVAEVVGAQIAEAQGAETHVSEARVAEVPAAPAMAPRGAIDRHASPKAWLRSFNSEAFRRAINSAGAKEAAPRPTPSPPRQRIPLSEVRIPSPGRGAEVRVEVATAATRAQGRAPEVLAPQMGAASQVEAGFASVATTYARAPMHLSPACGYRPMPGASEDLRRLSRPRPALRPALLPRCASPPTPGWPPICPPQFRGVVPVLSAQAPLLRSNFPPAARPELLRRQMAPQHTAQAAQRRAPPHTPEKQHDQTFETLLHADQELAREFITCSV